MELRKHLTYANVMATVATFGVLAGGGAYAASKIDTPDIKPKAVTKPKLEAKAVSAGKIAEGAVGTDQLNADTVGLPLVGLTYTVSGLGHSFNRVGDGAPRIEASGNGRFHIYFDGMEDRFDIIESVTSLDGGRVKLERTSCSGTCPPDHPVVVTETPEGTPALRSFTYIAYAATPTTSDVPTRSANLR